jgi:hypothetical protein
LKRDPHWPGKFTTKAWALATQAKDHLRDPAWGFELAGQAIQGVQAPTAAHWDTLAAAQAALGHFPEAIQLAHKALDLAAAANEVTLAKTIRNRLRYYESGKPFTENP